MASNTRCRGASNSRDIAISRSEGAVIFRVLSTLASTMLLLAHFGFTFWPRCGLDCLLRLLFRLHLFQEVVEAIEILVPEFPEVSEPAVDLPERHRRDPARPPLRLAPARDQAGMLQHLQVLRNRRKAHVKGFCEFHHRRLAERQPRQARPAGRIGECRKGRAEGVNRHLYLACELNNLWVKYSERLRLSTARLHRRTGLVRNCAWGAGPQPPPLVWRKVCPGP